MWIQGRHLAINARQVHLLNAGVLLQHPGQLLRSLVLLLNAQAKGLDAPEQQIGGVRIDDTTKDALKLANLIDEILPARKQSKSRTAHSFPTSLSPPSLPPSLQVPQS